jgi:hypothetical protein
VWVKAGSNILAAERRWNLPIHVKNQCAWGLVRALSWIVGLASNPGCGFPVHFFSQGTGPHICPYFFDVFKTFLLEATLAGILPAQWVLAMSRPD